MARYRTRTATQQPVTARYSTKRSAPSEGALQRIAATRLVRFRRRFVAPLVLATALGAAVTADTQAASLPRVKVPSVNVDEGQTARPSIVLACGFKSGCSYRVATSKMSATQGQDFQPRTIVKVLKRGQKLRLHFDVATISDTACEPLETFRVIVRSQIGGKRRSDSGYVHINADTDCGPPSAPTPTPTPTPTPKPTDPMGPDIQLYTLPECSVVLNGAISGADALTIFVAVRNGGPGSINRLVPVTMQSDTGLGSRTNSSISTGSAFSGLQVELWAGNYNRTHRFTITADPDNEIVERDESNNQLTVTVSLSARPTTSRDVPCSSP